MSKVCVYICQVFFFMNSQNDFLNDFKWSATTPCHIIWKDSYYIFQEL